MSLKYLIPIVLLLFSSCFAPKQVRKNARAERLVERATRLNPNLLDSVEVTFYDTIPVFDTIPLSGADIDTVALVVPGDSIVITDTVTRTEVVVRWVQADTSGLWAAIRLQVRPDTIYRRIEVPIEVQVPCPPTVEQTSRWRWLRSGYNWIMLLLIAGLLSLAVYSILTFKRI